ncbi:hypothetical protein [Dietzia aurantiaca]|uniref:hypothetical protein n=1 Tax=Dietzia aurantiaca TaxID=983873 RepID=UPI001E315B1D|nr:hypothetical protein [Dietzia aurantiaca]
MTSNLTHTYSPVQAYIIFSSREQICSAKGAIPQYSQLEHSEAAIDSFTIQGKPVDLPSFRLDHGEYQLMW